MQHLRKRGGPIFQFRFSSFQSAGACGDSFFFTDHGSLDTDHQSLTPLECAVPRFRALSPLECAVEHPTKDASPEGASRPKDLNVHVSLLECAVTQNITLSALECALTKTRPCKSFRMRSYEKRWGG